MISWARFLGGGLHMANSGNVTLLPNYRTFRMTETTLNLNYDARLPDARVLRKGHILAIGHETQSTGVLTVKGNSGAFTLFTLTNKGAKLWLQDNSTQDGIWRWRVR